MSRFKSAGRSSRSGRRGGAMALGVALVLGAVNANSQQAVSEAGPSLFQHIFNQLNTYRSQIEQSSQYIKDNTQWATDWAQTLKEYQEALVTVQGITNSFGLPEMNETLFRVDPRYLVAETCGTDANLMNFVSSLGFSETENWKSQQAQICVNIRMMQNRKYNESVDFMNITAPSFLSSLERITSLRLLSSKQGNMDAVASDSLRTANEMNAAAKNFEARMKSYDSYIDVMEANQKIVARKALNGQSTLFSDVVKTVALKTALSIK